MADKRKRNVPGKSKRELERRGRKSAKPKPKKAAAAPSRRLTLVGDAEQTRDSIVRIVGVGASAGGLEAISAMLEAIPADAGFAIVIVQHLHPNHESALPELLSSSTSMPVEEVTDGVVVKTNHVYVIPPGTVMCVVDGRLRLSPRAEDAARRTPIDVFLDSLAEYADGRAIGVILSGSGTDGVIGLRKVKASGGITLAQEPDSARFDGMPRAAVATGIVDFVGTPEELAAELARIARHPYLLSIKGADSPLRVNEEDLPTVLTLLRRETEVDFSAYKTATIKRRLQRRMALHKLHSVGDYARLLRTSTPEVRALYKDILIHVTGFFREPESFELLKTEVFPRICAMRDQAIRVWIPACSTGEEAYSIAIALTEFLGPEAGSVPIQIFATDVSEESIEQARHGFFPDGIAREVSEERLRRFFSKVEGGYRVKQSVREICVFARQDVTRDPPFSKLDLILCRNLLIYLLPSAQKRVMNVCHYALKPHGFLMLGEAETVGASDLFAVIDKKHKLYARKSVQTPMHLEMALAAPQLEARRAIKGRAEVGPVSREASRIILDRYSPPAIVVDNDLHIVEVRGQVGAYLQFPSGRVSLDVVKLAREGISHGLRSALQEARTTHARVRRDGLRVRENSRVRSVDIEVTPFPDSEGGPHLLVVFDEARPESADRSGARPAKGKRRAGSEQAQVKELERELELTRENMQAVIQDLEQANQELQSANEEVLSSNEELQSTNEELDTARAELQSTNEELHTVNEELQNRNDELLHANSDLMNLLASVQIAIVIVGGDLCIRRFTPMAERILNLMPNDVGRPIGHIKPNIKCDDLEDLIRRVAREIVSLERQVQDGEGRWYSMRLRPYKNADNQIDGAVLELFDVTAAKQHEEDLVRARDYAEAIIDSVGDPVVVLDAELRVQTVNRAFAESFDIPAGKARGAYLDDLGDGRWDVGALRRTLEQVLPENGQIENLKIGAELPKVGRRWMLLSAKTLEGRDQPGKFILLTMAPADRESPELA